MAQEGMPLTKELKQKLEKAGMFDMLQQIGIGGICFSPLAQGLLSAKYLNGIPGSYM